MNKLTWMRNISFFPDLLPDLLKLGIQDKSDSFLCWEFSKTILVLQILKTKEKHLVIMYRGHLQFWKLKTGAKSGDSLGKSMEISIFIQVLSSDLPPSHHPLLITYCSMLGKIKTTKHIFQVKNNPERASSKTSQQY